MRGAEVIGILTLGATNVDSTLNYEKNERILASLLGELVRAGRADRAFRYGGEEFCMLLPDITAEEAAELMDIYRETVQANTVASDGADLNVTVSIGVALFPGHGMDPKTLFEAADKALYAAKGRGRNQVVMVTEPERAGSARGNDAAA